MAFSPTLSFHFEALGAFPAPSQPFLPIADWIHEYGALITLGSGLEKVVIIGHYRAVMDIMENQGGTLADRPRTALGPSVGIQNKCPGQYVADRSAFISAVLIPWVFQLTLDPTKPLGDMGSMNVEKALLPFTYRPCTTEFEMMIPGLVEENWTQIPGGMGPILKGVQGIR
ncbi:uncharacterized protein BJ212DRAFT_1300744 [Suillus subaureus]|uniref:Cytochrome P450 n=1 Tax=Suillus subaureus TaxID=48587 RepID=A0A9P7JC77_9AGAM|nr:uncharacterized protein BJ212DRAFT_1300744 [Suillus subaureus]KAG1813848.1 hypothetical protein BJ212DRAFT_1300744 [Suillus subaureus]